MIACRRRWLRRTLPLRKRRPGFVACLEQGHRRRSSTSIFRARGYRDTLWYKDTLFFLGLFEFIGVFELPSKAFIRTFLRRCREIGRVPPKRGAHANMTPNAIPAFAPVLRGECTGETGVVLPVPGGATGSKSTVLLRPRHSA
jgi:hypothetical protein